MRARGLLGLVAAASLVAGCGGSSHTQSSTVQRRSSATAPAPAAPVDPVLARLGLPPITHASPLPGYLMIADRDNNRLLIVNPSHRIVWRFPPPGELLTGQQFAGPDDAFVSADHRSIITNEEFSDTIAVVSLSRRPRIVWEYGHQGVQGSGPGYLAHPDDAYLLGNGRIQVADIINCRVLWLNRAKQIVRSIGTAGDCATTRRGPCSSRMATRRLRAAA